MAVFDVILNDKITDLKDLLQADPKCANSVGWHGLTPLHHAALKNNEELIDLLLQDQDVGHEIPLLVGKCSEIHLVSHPREDEF